MTQLFWVSAILVAYAFIGYAGLAWLLARFNPKGVTRRPMRPSVSIVMVVHNEGERLPAKLENLSTLDYPKEKLELVVASDGSTDRTEDILRSCSTVKAVLCPRVGKAEALNRAIVVTSNEIVVFTDARQQIEPSAIAELVSNFADESVGCVSGELMFRTEKAGVVGGISAYWQFEKLIRKCESASGSVVGVTGALYALRRTLIPRLPAGTLLDDLYIPLHVTREGKRVIFEPKARAWDEPSQCGRLEFRRKVRTLAGNLQMLQLAPWALLRDGIRFRYVSHKLMRLCVPWLLIAMLVSAWVLAASTFYLIFAILQSIFYGLAAMTTVSPVLRRWSLANGARAFCLMNAAAVVALLAYVRHRRDPIRIWTGGAANPATVKM